MIDPRPGTPPENMTDDPGNAQPGSASQPNSETSTGGYARTDPDEPQGRAAADAGDPQADAMEEGQPD
jgi:hypothetical protein